MILSFLFRYCFLLRELDLNKGGMSPDNFDTENIWNSEKGVTFDIKQVNHFGGRNVTFSLENRANHTFDVFALLPPLDNVNF